MQTPETYQDSSRRHIKIRHADRFKICPSAGTPYGNYYYMEYRPMNVFKFVCVTNLDMSQVKVVYCIMCIHTYKTKKLPNMVGLITKQTLPLNSHQKIGPGYIHTYNTKKLPNMVSLITKRTSSLNFHQKTGPEHIYTYKTTKLPNMVSLITKQTPLLNSHQKTGPGHISYVPY